MARRLELLLESTYEGICAVDVDGRCTLVNSAAAAMLGWERDEILGRDFRAIAFAPADGETCTVTRVLQTGKAQRSGPIRLRRKDGTTFPSELSAAPLREGETTHGAVLSFADFTERLALQAELERASRLGALGQMAATLAHEFNNVLMGIQVFAEILRKRAPDSQPSVVGQILQSVQRGRRVTEEVLRFGRPTEPARRPFSVECFLACLASEACATCPAGIEVRTACDTPGLRIEGDEEQLSQVFLNLAGNARDAMGAHGTLTISVAPCAEEACRRLADDRPRVHILVRDTGPGIPPDIIHRVFEPFFTTKRRGTGLGLALAHQIVSAHGGHIRLTSRPEEGTEVHVLLDRAEAPASEPEDAVPAPAAGDGVASALIVEDEELIATGLIELLGAFGIRCRWAALGRDAVPAVEETVPDVVILDVGLPDMQGTEVFDALRTRWPELPVVFSTGHADQVKLEPYLAYPHVRHLRKPFDVNTLLEAIQGACGTVGPVLAGS